MGGYKNKNAGNNVEYIQLTVQKSMVALDTLLILEYRQPLLKTSGPQSKEQHIKSKI